MGHEVTIYTFSLQYPAFLFPGKTQYSESQPPHDLDIRVEINSVNPANWISVGHRISREMADLVIIRYWLPFMGPCLGTVARIIRKNGKTRITGLIDNALPHEKRPGDKWFTKYFVRSLDGFVTMSQYVMRDLKQFTDKKVYLARHPLYDNFGQKFQKSEARKSLGLPAEGYVYLFFGFIRKYKGLDLLIKAFENLPPADNVYLLIAGEYYAGEDEIRDQIADSPARERILPHTHFIRDEDVALYFSASDCVVQPYRNATQSGVTPLAYHFEVPMIVTNVGALPDLVPPGLGEVCDPDPEAIKDAMVRIRNLNQQSFKSQISEAKKELSWEKLVETILESAKTH